MTEPISTQVFLNTPRIAAENFRAKITVAQTEATTGRLADTGLTLGYSTGQDVTLRRQAAELDTVKASNGIVSTNLEASQSAFKTLSGIATEFLKTLIAVTTSATPQAFAAAQQQASSALSGLKETLNTSVGGTYIFGGINSSAPPIAADIQQTAQPLVDAAFAGALGVAQTSPAAANVLPANLGSFLNVQFSAIFASLNPVFSNASSTPSNNRIGATEYANTSVTANESAFSDLAAAYASVATIGVPNLNASSVQSLVTFATQKLGSATQELGVLQTRLGLVQSSIASSNDTIAIQQSLFHTETANLEAIDPYEASTRVTALTNELETSYSLTSRLSKLSLLNYI